MIKVENKNITYKKFLLTEFKIAERQILKSDGFLRPYAVYSPIKDVTTKMYYDTPDAFFQSKGIIININRYKRHEKSELILRYNTKIQRIGFLNDIPDTFIFRIDRYKKITDFSTELADYLYQLYPSGFGVDIEEKIKELKLYLEVIKKRKRYKAVSATGLKVVLSFEKNKFINHFNGNNRIKIDMLELRLDSEYSRTNKLFDNFLHDLTIQYPNLIKLAGSDLTIGQEYLGMNLDSVNKKSAKPEEINFSAQRLTKMQIAEQTAKDPQKAKQKAKNGKQKISKKEILAERQQKEQQNK